MASHYKYIIVGRGMLGAAAARHLAGESCGVALIGPDEPADAASHTGVFASHYDEARITRTIDRDPVWAALAKSSIARYAEISKASGIDFYHEAGCLIVGPKRGGSNPYIADVERAAASLGVAVEMLDGAALAERFPFFSFEDCSEGVFEGKQAGYVNPRRLVAAQSLLAERAGTTIVRQTVDSVRQEGGRVVVTTAQGERFTADKVMIAAGGFSIAQNLLPVVLDLKVYARTVAFFEVAASDLSAFAGMPSLICEPHDPSGHIYLLPPVTYPDGRTYLKIGGDPDDLQLSSEPEIRTWFRSGGRDSTRLHLSRIIDSLVPRLAGVAPTMAACVTSFTPSGYPAIGYSGSDRIAVLTGGCGAAAKSSDEIGRLGARLLLDGELGDGDPAAHFRPHFL
ncbi:MAG: NAD(P)/FAD-dependent oxidoreductase [Allorhizobium sp.]